MLGLHSAPLGASGLILETLYCLESSWLWGEKVSVPAVSSFLSFLIQFNTERSSRFGFTGKIIKQLGRRILDEVEVENRELEDSGCGLQGELEGGDWKVGV